MLAHLFQRYGGKTLADKLERWKLEGESYSPAADRRPERVARRLRGLRDRVRRNRSAICSFPIFISAAKPTRRSERLGLQYQGQPVPRPAQRGLRSPISATSIVPDTDPGVDRGLGTGGRRTGSARRTSAISCSPIRSGCGRATIRIFSRARWSSRRRARALAGGLPSEGRATALRRHSCARRRARHFSATGLPPIFTREQRIRLLPQVAPAVETRPALQLISGEVEPSAGPDRKRIIRP